MSEPLPNSIVQLLLHLSQSYAAVNRHFRTPQAQDSVAVAVDVSAPGLWLREVPVVCVCV